MATEPTRSTPSSAAVARIHVTAGPSSGSAPARSWSGVPSTLNFSGSTMSVAPPAAAARTCSSAAARFAAGSGPEFSCTAAARTLTHRSTYPAVVPWRSDLDGRSRPVDVPLPPARMPLLHAGRPLKRWRWVGVFSERVMLCVGFVRVAGVPQAWWAVWHREAAWMRERTLFVRPTAKVRLSRGTVRVRDGDCAIDLDLAEVAGV